jgi:hypothetical protein
MCDDCWVQVYTTIFLAETIDPDMHEAEQSIGESIGDRETEHRLLEIKRTTLECITMLEARNWFTGELPSDD